MGFLEGDAAGATVSLPDAAGVNATLEQWTRESAVFAELLAAYGSPAFALRHFSLLRRRDGDHEGAAAAFLAALSLAPDDVWLWRDLAGVYQQMSRKALAVTCIRRALAIDAAHAPTWLQYAILADGMAPAELVEQAFLRALALDPDLADANFGLGLLYLKTLRFDEAAIRLSDAARRADPDAIVLLSLGNALYMAAKFVDSAAAYAKASALAPLEGLSLRKFARARTFAAFLEGDIDRALADYPALAGAEPSRWIRSPGTAFRFSARTAIRMRRSPLDDGGCCGIPKTPSSNI